MLSSAKKRVDLFKVCSNVTSTPATPHRMTTKTGRAVVAMTGQRTPTEQSATRGDITSHRTIAAGENKAGACALPPEGCQPRGLVARLRSKLRKPIRCEKCRHRSDTCRPNASFVSGRKHYLCEDCRVTSDNMKNLYHQLLHGRRNQHFVFEAKVSEVTLDDAAVSDCSASSSATDRSGTAAESGYDTAASSDSVGSERLGFRGCSSPSPSPTPLAAPRPRPPSYERACSRMQVFQCDKGRGLEQDAKVPRQDGQVESSAGNAEQRHAGRMQELLRRLEGVDLASSGGGAEASRPRPAYDGYLDTSCKSSRANLRVLKSPAAALIRDGPAVQPMPPVPSSRGFAARGQGLGSSTGRKTCTSCLKSTSVAFRLPWNDGWICEDCMDDMV